MGLCGRCLSEFKDWRYIQSCWYFRPRFMNCCLSLLLSGSTLPPPLFPVWLSILYTSIQCVKGKVCGSGPQTDKYLPQSPFTGKKFVRRRHFALLYMSLIFLRIFPSDFTRFFIFLVSPILGPFRNSCK